MVHSAIDRCNFIFYVFIWEILLENNEPKHLSLVVSKHSIQHNQQKIDLLHNAATSIEYRQPMPNLKLIVYIIIVHTKQSKN